MEGLLRGSLLALPQAILQDDCPRCICAGTKQRREEMRRAHGAVQRQHVGLLHGHHREAQSPLDRGRGSAALLDAHARLLHRRGLWPCYERASGQESIQDGGSRPLLQSDNAMGGNNEMLGWHADGCRARCSALGPRGVAVLGSLAAEGGRKRYGAAPEGGEAAAFYIGQAPQ